MINGKPLTRCPVMLITDGTRRMMSLYTHYKNGYLPASGGIMEQTAYFYQAVEILDSWVSRIQRDMADKRQEKLMEKKGRPTAPRRGAPRKLPRRGRRPRKRR